MAIDVSHEILTQRLQEMIQLWQKYMEIFNRSLESEEEIPEEEKEFRTLQKEITRRAQYLRIAIPDNLFDLWKDMKKLLKETPSLMILKKEVPIKLSSFRNMWHEVSISLNQKQGHLRSLLDEREMKKTSKRSK
ncbi:MAG: hypothetical protein C4527_00780 [Candidatus Omnitrophota bacterium]|jgi:hypothetical protein|nr:MAG: hypothetical protein C4527_00780 [Candidatus Omnitrophota bacterium]